MLQNQAMHKQTLAEDLLCSDWLLLKGLNPSAFCCELWSTGLISTILIESAWQKSGKLDTALKECITDGKEVSQQHTFRKFEWLLDHLISLVTRSRSCMSAPRPGPSSVILNALGEPICIQTATHHIPMSCVVSNIHASNTPLKAVNNSARTNRHQ